jgi:hypothetical protein
MINDVIRRAPYSVAPGYVIETVQNTDFKKYLGAMTTYGNPSDNAFYTNTIFRASTPSAVGMQWGDSEVVSADNGQMGFFNYAVRTRYEFTDHDADKFNAITGQSLQRLSEQLCTMAINQRLHRMALFPADPSETSQGILANGTAGSFPEDSDAHTTIKTYNTWELVQVLAEAARDAMDNTYGQAKPVVLASSVRVINYLKTAMVPLVNAQMQGSGTYTVSGAYSEIIGRALGVGAITLVSDDLLKGTATGGKDYILFISPGLDEADPVPAEISQNLLGDGQVIKYNTNMNSAGSLRKKIDPNVAWVNRGHYEIVTTCGYCVRKEAIQILEATYE